MPRSIEEIDAELAEVRRLKTLRDALGYKRARTKAILTRDTSDLNNVYTALANAEQNRLNRESAEKIAKASKDEAEKETRDNIVKNLNTSAAVWRDSAGNENLSNADKIRAREEAAYWQQRAIDKGIEFTPIDFDAELSDIQNGTIDGKVPWKQIAANANRVADTENSTVEAIDAESEKINSYRGNDFTTKEANEILAKLNNRKNTITENQKEAGWAKRTDEIAAAIKAKDKAKLQQLRKDSEEFNDRKTYATEMQKIDSALKPPKVDTTLRDWVKNNIKASTIQLLNKTGSDYNTKGEVVRNQTIKGKNYKYIIAKKADGGAEVLDEKRNSLMKFSKDDLDISKSKPKRELPKLDSLPKKRELPPTEDKWKGVVGGNW
jgi:hypothetical protein